MMMVGHTSQRPPIHTCWSAVIVAFPNNSALANACVAIPAKSRAALIFVLAFISFETSFFCMSMVT